MPGLLAVVAALACGARAASGPLELPALRVDAVRTAAPQAFPRGPQLPLPFMDASSSALAPITAAPAPLAAAAPAGGPAARAVLAHFAANWTLGSEWTPPETSDPEARHLARTLSQAVASANEAHKRSVDGLTLAVDGMAHDVRNSMATTPLAVAMLRKSPNPRALDILERSHSTAKTTIDTYLALARADSGRLEVRPEPLVAADLFLAAAENAAPLAAQKKIEVEVWADPAYKVIGDARTLSVVAANLLGNAIKYTPEGGLVMLRVEKDPKDPARFRLDVQDSGIGITPEDQAKVFSGHRTEAGKKLAAGTGFGLQLVKRLVEANGSRIELESASGEGSTFSFSLPAAR